MQNMWISIVLIVLVIVVGLIAGRRLSAPGPQRRAVYSAFGTLAVLAIWFFLFVTFFPGEWIVPFFTVACIVIPICIYMGVARGGTKKKVGSTNKSFEIPRKVVTPEPAKPAKATKQAAAPKQQAKPVSTSTPTQASPTSSTSSAKTNAPSAKAAPTEKAVHAAAKPSTKAPEKAASAKSEASKAPEKAAQKKDAAPKTAPTKQAQASQQKPADKPVEEKKQESAKAPAPSSGVEATAANEAAAAKEVSSTKQENKPRTTSTPQKPAPTPAPSPAPSSTPSPEHKPETKQQPVASQEKPQETKSAEERIFEKPLDKPVVSEAIDPKISAAADIDILVNKAVAEELNDLEELVRPFGNNPAETLPVDQGPDLNVGAPLSASATSHHEPKTEAPSTPEPPTPSTSTPAPAAPTTSAPVKPKPKQSPKEAFEEFSKRAAALRDQGAYAIAAMLYEEAATLAPTVNDMRNTQFDELACYVKAGDADKAKALASKLRQSSVLTRFERIKLDAVERMS